MDIYIYGWMDRYMIYGYNYTGTLKDEHFLVIYKLHVSSLSSGVRRVPDFILGTVHKAKGLEFDTVMVTDDFAKIPTSENNRPFSFSTCLLAKQWKSTDICKRQTESQRCK